MTPQKALLSCSTPAAERLAPYEAKISDNFEMPMHVGKLIAAWDRPKFVTATDACHMRDDDYVVGLVYQGQSRAYPLWITDNYHMINDRLAGDPILFSTCERCQSGAAFLSRIDGQSVSFSAMGMYNASLTMVNRKRRREGKHSLWLHYEGVAIDGPLKGQFLEQLPTFHMTWACWRQMHPDTDVMLAPNDPHHRDARHGHGREEFFSRPGMDPPLAKTITGHFDQRYPENELVLGLNIDAGIRAYPLLEVHREGGVVHGQLGDLSIVVFSGPRPDQVTLSAFSSNLNGQTLTFTRTEEGFQDQQTGSTWTIEGKAITGELKNQSLTPLRWQYVRWHAWVYPHPTTELYRSTKPLPSYPNGSQSTTTTFEEILKSLSRAVDSLSLSHTIVELSLPHEASEGLCLVADKDRLNLYRFTSPEAAQDYVDLQGAWYCMPFDTKVSRKRARRLGALVLESDPANRYAEPTQTVHYPDNQTAWSRLIDPQPEQSDWAQAWPPQPPVEGHFMALIQGLRQKRHDIVECAFLPHSQQRVGTLSTIAATIHADRFAIYRCENPQAAQNVAAEVGHALHVGRWVLRSIPVLMYQDPHYEMGQLPDDQIRWSPLLTNERFHADLEAVISP